MTQEVLVIPLGVFQTVFQPQTLFIYSPGFYQFAEVKTSRLQR